MNPFKKNIFIPFNSYNDAIGGPATFMRHLRNYMDEHNHKYTTTEKWINSIFFPVSYNIESLMKLKNKGVKIIQRLDGVYYPSKHGKEYIDKNAIIKKIHNELADCVIYQSNYSKKQCEKMLGHSNPKSHHIIINGTSKKIFYPKKANCPNMTIRGKVKLLVTGVFRHIEMIELITSAIEIVYPKFEISLKTIGPIVNEQIHTFLDKPYVTVINSVSQKELADETRNTDLFIYSILNPACPNSVIEAISCGVPVIGFNTGAMGELLYFNKELLAEVSGDLFQESKDLDTNKLSDKIMLAIENFAYFKQKAMEHAHLYSFEQTGRQYINVFNPDHS